MNLSNEVNSPDVLFLQELRVALAVILGGLTPGLFVVFVHFNLRLSPYLTLLMAGVPLICTLLGVVLLVKCLLDYAKRRSTLGS